MHQKQRRAAEHVHAVALGQLLLVAAVGVHDEDRGLLRGAGLGGPAAASQNLEKLLPYAIALEVKEAWGDQLAQAFRATVFTEQ